MQLFWHYYSSKSNPLKVFGRDERETWLGVSSWTEVLCSIILLASTPPAVQRATWWTPFDLQLRGSGQPGCGECAECFLPADLLNGTTLTVVWLWVSHWCPLGQSPPTPFWISFEKDIGGGGSVGFLCTLTFQCGFSAICLHFLLNCTPILTPSYTAVSPNNFKPSLRDSRAGWAGKSPH